jgi:hypothetical protein
MTRIGQRSQTAARAAQLLALAPIPMRRSRAETALAAARLSVAKAFRQQAGEPVMHHSYRTFARPIF